MLSAPGGRACSLYMPNGVDMVHNEDGSCPDGSSDETMKLSETYTMMMMTSPPPAPPPPFAPPPAGLSTGALIGVIAGAVVLVGVITLVVCLAKSTKAAAAVKAAA